MRCFFLILLIVSANTYAASNTYCHLLWLIPHFQAQSFKKVNELEYDLVIKTAYDLRLLSRVSENMYPWSNTTVYGWSTYWVWFDDGYRRFPNGIEYEIISVNGEKTPRTLIPLNVSSNKWENGCTTIDIGSALNNWGNSTNITLRLKTRRPIAAGFYNFSGMSLPLKIMYEENKGLYANSSTVLNNKVREALYISVDNWNLEIKAPACSHNQPSLDFGQITYDQAKTGVSISKELSLFCKANPTSVKLYFKDTHKTVSDAPCGNDPGKKNCQIKIGDDDKEYVEFNMNNFSSTGSGTVNIPIKVTFKSQTPMPGKFKDSVIIIAEVN
ncbi:TPA: hypothetical protein ACG1RS_004359 [Escherichia coli]